MRFSRDWIGAYTELPDTDELVDVLSMLGWVVDDASPRGQDISFDLDMPSNRPDALSHLALAREIGVKTGTVVAALDRDFERGPTDTDEIASVRIDDPVGCRRFVARALLDVTVGPSPDWMIERLESIGLRPINNVVDVTNYVMWEMGRPLHAYDLDLLAGHGLIVRRAVDGERLVTLDDVERKLTSEDLVIADGDGPVGLAGVMGGTSTGVTESTRRVLLECACFDAVTIRRMARRHGMHTDASHRFERGMSILDIDEAVERACHLLADRGVVSAAGIDVRGETRPDVRIDLPADRLTAYLGVEIEPSRVEKLFDAIGFGIEIRNQIYRVEVPARRVDIELEVDLIEEVARFHGYDRIPSTLPPLRKRDSEGPEPALRAERRLKDVCAALGYWEAMTFAFTGADEQACFLPADSQQIALANPLSEAMAVMRSALMPGLLGALARNRNRGADRARLFEIGRIFRPGEAAPAEARHLAFVGFGPELPEHFGREPREHGFLDVKGAVEAIARRSSWPALEWRAGDAPGWLPAATAEVVAEGRPIGLVGQIAPEVAAAFDLEVAIWAAELDIESFLDRPTHDADIAPLPRFPSSERDVSLLVAADVPYRALEERIAAAEEPTLESVRLLDRYEGDDLESGSVAVTLRLTYRAANRTLTADEIETAHDRIVAGIERELGAARR